MASFRVQASSVTRIGNKVSLQVRFRSTDGTRTSQLQYFEVEAVTTRGVEDALKASAREWDRRGAVVVQNAPTVRTGVDVDSEEVVS